MKIQINQFEKYEIHIPEEVTCSEFHELFARLQYINKLVEKDPLMTLSKNIPDTILKGRKRGKKMKYPFFQSRESTIEFIRMWKSMNTNEREMFASGKGYDRIRLDKSMYQKRAQYKIKNDELEKENGGAENGENKLPNIKL